MAGTLRQIIEGILKSRVPNPGREFFNAAVESGSWTATIRGSGTAGTYEIATQQCRYTRIGRRVWLDVRIVLAAAITGGGTSLVQIIGIPFAKSANTFPAGATVLVGVDWTAGSNLTLAFDGVNASSILGITQTQDDASIAGLPVSGLAANDQIIGSICYETDDP